ncbi:RNA polymerase sigma factor [Chitinophaga arvensicola]|uniref:RNA polymerase sigma-70 factor, ECF subfamily n=1 Tax=Chitinophaga arvensicola TaxID=29529 RepID=A0A1I0RAL5_9BACT|nr:sigma-70 family RNA polymerase sigma factor [Chitinophaga arvensicola]SEW37872.1 RNA polymerase sigma-70 factor, ECF subfamily [Chitinophaga arvensicola]
MESKDLHNEKQLFLLIADSNEEAFETLYRTLFPRFLPYLYKLLGSDVAVEEVLQDTLIKFWLSRHKLTEILHPHAWLFRILANEALRYLRRQNVQLKAKDKFQALQEDLNGSGSSQTELDLSFRETQRIIGKIVDGLSPRQKIIYRLSREQGLKVPQIAEELNVSSNYVQKTLSLALKIIQQRLLEKGIFIPILLLLFKK